MHIKSLIIERYKSFREPITIPFSENFNLFIGPNNSGKTNIVDAIDFLLNPQKKPSRLHDSNAELELQIALSPQEQDQFTCSPTVSLKGSSVNVQCVDASGKQMGITFQAAVAKQLRSLFYIDFSDFIQIKNDYASLIRRYPEVHERFRRMLQQYFPEVRAIRKIISVEIVNPTDYSATRSVPLERLGSGFRRVFVMLLYALHPSYSMVMIDEPEIHLHPGLIKKFLRALTSETTNQIIATSHSPLMISAQHLHEVYRVLKDEQGSHIYFLQQSRRRLDRKRLVQELNADNLELFFADKVLLVEGVSDRILMRGLIDRFYKGSDDIKVIYTHGKSNIDTYIDLMQVFHIPYVVMLDRDALRTIPEHLRALRGKSQYHGKGRQTQLKQFLQENHIVILPNGTIEYNYPRRYQRRDTKPLNALYAAANITLAEYNSPRMKNLKSIIDQL